MSEECLICGEPLIYLSVSKEMTCALCGRKEMSRTQCKAGHFICDACHEQGLDQVASLCYQSDSKDPLVILEQLMAQPYIHMHGPEHHILVGAALLTACHNSGAELDLSQAIPEVIRRGRQVPGGVCGSWGACGAGIGTGIALSILQDATPLSVESFGKANRMTSEALRAIGNVGGPRCCKRDSRLALLSAVRFIRNELGLSLEMPQKIQCRYPEKNEQCIRDRCPFYPEADSVRSDGSF